MRKLKVSYTLEEADGYFFGLQKREIKRLAKAIEDDIVHEIIHNQTRDNPVEFLKISEKVTNERKSRKRNR